MENIRKLIQLFCTNRWSHSANTVLLNQKEFCSGYTNNNSSPFKKSLQVSFLRGALIEQCQQRNCIETAFINCAICSKKLWFDHFFLNYHFHKKIRINRIKTYCELNQNNLSRDNPNGFLTTVYH